MWMSKSKKSSILVGNVIDIRFDLKKNYCNIQSTSESVIRKPISTRVPWLKLSGLFRGEEIVL